MNLGPRDDAGEVNLHAERYDVRQSAKRSTYTGKTYNSLDNISQFFGERGMPFKPAAQAAAAEAGFTYAAAIPAAHRQPSAAPAGARRPAGRPQGRAHGDGGGAPQVRHWNRGTARRGWR